MEPRQLFTNVVLEPGAVIYSQPFNLYPADYAKLEMWAVSTSATGTPPNGAKADFQLSDDLENWRPPITLIEHVTLTSAPSYGMRPDSTSMQPEYAMYGRVRLQNQDTGGDERWMVSVRVTPFKLMV